MPCKPFFKKSFEAQSESRIENEAAPRAGDLNNSPSPSQDGETGIFLWFTPRPGNTSLK
jgi:hypothetical protein